MQGYEGIPEHMVGGLTRYIDTGQIPGDFLTAVLENDLREAVARADHINITRLPAYVSWLYNNAPAPCWGSPAKVKAWVEGWAERRKAAAP